MTTAESIAATAVLTSIVLFAIGQWIACCDRRRAGRRSEESIGLAKESLEIAREAKRAASVGNELADDSNRIAAEAKNIAQRAADALEKNATSTERTTLIEQLQALAGRILKAANHVSPPGSIQVELGQSDAQRMGKRNRRQWSNEAGKLASEAEDFADRLRARLCSETEANATHTRLSKAWEEHRGKAEPNWGVK